MVGRAVGDVLDRRALNRALLARQLLLRRVRRSALQTVGHLVGMQSQNPDPPYVGLWSRLAGFAPSELADLVLERRVVRIAAMRSTIHLVTADDCLSLRRLVQPALERSFQSNQGKRLGGADTAEVTARGRGLVDAEPRTFSELGTLLAPHFPSADPDALAMAVRTWVPLVQVPPRGVWGRSGRATHTSAEHWLGAGSSVEPRPDALVESVVLRYLAAFGPASVADVQKWSGLTRLSAVVERLREQLVPFRSDQGIQLWDLPEAPRPDPATLAPPRLLAEYDNVLVSHADRSRILGDTDPAMVMTQNGLVLGAVLVDGFVAGRWRAPRAPSGALSVTVTTTRRLRPDDRAAVADEALSLLTFLAPDQGGQDVRFTVSSDPASAGSVASLSGPTSRPVRRP